LFYKETEPGSVLATFIKCIWVLEHDYSGPYHNYEHLWADANAELILTSGHPYYLKSGSRRQPLSNSFVIGPFKRELNLYSDGLTKLVAVRFWPWGLFQFSQKPMLAVVNGIFPAEDIFGAKIKALIDSLVEKANDDSIALVRNFFSAEVKNSTRRKSVVHSIGSRMLSDQGRMSISALTREFNLSQRRLERIFRTETGLSPKAFSRVIRFNHAKRLIQKDPDISLAELTGEAGYCDQAHFSKTFKEMFGITPGTFKKQMKRTRALLAELKPDVEFLQDA